MVIVTYKVDSKFKLEEISDIIANEQSSFIPEYAISKKSNNEKETNINSQFSAKVIDTRELNSKENLFYPKIYNGEIDIQFPEELYGNSVTGLINTIIGEVYHISKISQIRVNDISFGKNNSKWCVGPQFGSSGIRKFYGTDKRPTLIGPVKPVAGITPSEFSLRAYSAWLGGADIVKEDELLVPSDIAKVKKRLSFVNEMKCKAQDKAGTRKGFIANLITPFEEIKQYIDLFIEQDVDGVLVAPGVQGFGIISYIRKNYDGLIFAHCSALSGWWEKDSHGISSALIAKLIRNCGADSYIIPSPWGSFSINEEEFFSTIHALTDCGNDIKIRSTLPALAGGLWAGNINKCIKSFENTNYGIVSGAGLFHHPQGAMEGAQSIIEAIDLSLKGSDVWDQLPSDSPIGRILRKR